ncbi:MAG: ketoacyl-ACP synthase III [Bacteroidia bacterium]|nr:ketoacyl-ACP synthase III [Bacteroidia bacterium]
MITQFKNKKISSILSVIPTNEVSFMDEIGNYSFSESQMKKLKKVMGFDKRRVASIGETISDYAVFGIRKMIEDKVFNEEEIGAIIVTTTTQDHFIPPVSNIIQGQFNFDADTVCIDISQGCCGYTVGLVYSFMTLNSLKNKKVLLVAGDLLSFRVSTRDRASRPIVGDAVTISVIENTIDDNVIYCSLKNNGKAAFSVYIPAGGLKIPITPESIKEEEDEFGNWRGKQHLVMNGDLVFNFIINDTPLMIEELLKEANENIDNVDYFICHQSSSFTLKKLAERLNVSQERLPNDIVPIYGNSSSATIPVTLCHHYENMFSDKDKLKIMLAAFGTGLSLGSVLFEVQKFEYCKIVDYPHKN